MHPKAGVCKRQQEGPVAQVSQALFLVRCLVGCKICCVFQNGLNRTAWKLREALAGAASALSDEQADTGQVDVGEACGCQKLVPSGHRGQVETLAGRGVVLQVCREVRHPVLGDLLYWHRVGIDLPFLQGSHKGR